MNADDVLMYGMRTVDSNLDQLSGADWTAPHAIGLWTIKDVVAHMVSFEWLLVDVIRSLNGEQDLPWLELYTSGEQRFNLEPVEERRDCSPEELRAEYRQAHVQARELLAQLPAEKRTTEGLLPWYGSEYDLEDFIVYANYGHKREHTAQIALVRDRRKLERGVGCV